jgi:predicted transcriptional regulator with HTH domain
LRESYAGLERKVDERTRELTNSLEQQTAISEILRVISSSPTDVQPVLDAVAERAAHLCDAPTARVLLIDGEILRPMAEYSTLGSGIPQVRPYAAEAHVRQRAGGPRPRDGALRRRGPVVRVGVPRRSGERRQAGHPRHPCRGPLCGRRGYGAILLWRNEPRAFSPDQVALVQTFAAQAAIAIDNVRLFNQTKEALEQQTAISEILRVISNSPTDVQPVLDAVAERAAQLCEAPLRSGVAGRRQFPAAACGAHRQRHRPAMPSGEIPLTHATINGRAVLEGRTIHFDDAAPLFETEFRDARDVGLRAGLRSTLSVPLMREGGATA